MLLGALNLAITFSLACPEDGLENHDESVISARAGSANSRRVARSQLNRMDCKRAIGCNIAARRDDTNACNGGCVGRKGASAHVIISVRPITLCAVIQHIVSNSLR